MIIIIMMTHLPSIQPDLVAAPQQPRQVKRARKAVTTMLKKKFLLEVTHYLINIINIININVITSTHPIRRKRK